MKKIGVIGIGNPLRRDDGIGLILLEKLMKKQQGLPQRIECIDGGTGGMNLLHLLHRFDIVLVIDAVNFGGKVGESKVFNPENAKNDKSSLNLSSHDPGFLQVVQLSKKLSGHPAVIKIFGVQPRDTSYGTTLSPELENKINLFVDEIITEINKLSEMSI